MIIWCAKKEYEKLNHEQLMKAKIITYISPQIARTDVQNNVLTHVLLTSRNYISVLISANGDG